MRKIFLSLIASSLSILCLTGSSNAQYGTSEFQDGRYVLVMVSSAAGNVTRSYALTKVPAVVLDTVLGIVWRCPNIQEEQPRWIKTDLGKEQDKALSARKYLIRILDWPVSGLKIPAIVLDQNEGKVWNCPNILDENAVWIPKDLTKVEAYLFNTGR
jgi:hypothetical protein